MIIFRKLKSKRVDEVDRTPAKIFLSGGMDTLVLKWKKRKKGIQVKTPSDEFKWN